MAHLTQFPGVTGEDMGENNFAFSINFSGPVTVEDDETIKEATERWLESKSDEELGAFVREKTWEYWQ